MIKEIFKNQNKLDKIAVIEKNEEINYKRLMEESILISKYIQMNKSENIGIFLANGYRFIAGLLGTFIGEKVALPMNVLMKDEEIINLIDFCNLTTIVSSIDYKHIFERIIINYNKRIIILYIEELTNIECDLHSFYKETSPDNTMLLITTSGTTGNPKIVQLSELNISTAVLGFTEKLNLTEENIEELKLVLSTPFYTSYGIMLILVCILNEIPILIMEGIFSLDQFYKTVEKYRVTHYEGGTIIATLMEQTIGKHIPYDIKSLKYIAFGGSKVSGETMNKLLKSYPDIKFWQGYGMSEASPLISKPSLKLKDMEKYHQKLKSAGNIIENVKVYIDNNGTITDKPNVLGEILVKGKNVMQGYYKNEKILKNHYLYTGDIGYLDEDNYLYIKGRKKNIIIVKGINIYPEEIELFLMNSGLVKDCYVYGQEITLSKEVVCIDIVPINNQIKEKDIRNYFNQNLSNIKHPKIINFVEDIYRGNTGKLLRR